MRVFEPESTLQAAPSPYPVETYAARKVSRFVQAQLHREGCHVANFVGDATAMLEQGRSYGLNDRDERFLTHALKCCIRPAFNVEEAEVSMSGRQWGRFVGIRRSFLKARRDPANLIAVLKAKYRVVTPSPSPEIEISNP